MQSGGKAETILVVDDEAVNRDLMRAVLGQRHDVLLAEDGEHALELLRESRPRLIIVDLHLPGMSGTDFIKRVRQDQNFAGTSIAIYTASDVSAALRDFMQLMKVEHVIPKPAEPEAIASVVRDAVR